MSVYGKLIHVSPPLLEKLIQNPDLMWMLLKAQWMMDPFYWQELLNSAKLSAVDLTRIDRVLDSLDDEVLDSQDDEVTMWLKRLKTEEPERFEQIKPEILPTLSEAIGKGRSLDKNWDALHYLLTQSTAWTLPFLVNLCPKNNLLINAIQGGARFSFHNTEVVRYLTVPETRQVAQGLAQISVENFKVRFTEAVILSPEVYSGNWQQQHSHYLEDLEASFGSLVQYYQEADEVGNAMLIEIN